jgi:hypothetical protein
MTENPADRHFRTEHEEARRPISGDILRGELPTRSELAERLAKAEQERDDEVKAHAETCSRLLSDQRKFRDAERELERLRERVDNLCERSPNCLADTQREP